MDAIEVGCSVRILTFFRPCSEASSSKHEFPEGKVGPGVTKHRKLGGLLTQSDVFRAKLFFG